MKFENIELSCAYCAKKLVNLMKVKPGPTQRFQASCPFCDGKSSIVEIDGVVYHGPIADEESQSTVIIDVDYNLDDLLVTFKIGKVKQ